MSNVDLMNESEAQWFKRQIVEAKADGRREAIEAALATIATVGSTDAECGARNECVDRIRAMLPPTG